MKYAWRKSEKVIYFPKQIELVTIPKYSFVILDGLGDPNSEQFSNQIEALYTASYALRMGIKKGNFSNEPFEYTVFPLEGVWTTTDGSRNETLNKAALKYRIMIRQPKMVTTEMFNKALEQALQKKTNPYLKKVQFESYEEGKVVQLMHVGSFDNEPLSFEKLENFMLQHQLQRQNTMNDYQHREIYLSEGSMKSWTRFSIIP